MFQTMKSVFFSHYVLNVNFSVTMRPKYLRFSLAIARIHMQGTVSQNFNLGFSSYFMTWKTSDKKIVTKSFLFFNIK